MRIRMVAFLAVLVTASIAIIAVPVIASVAPPITGLFHTAYEPVSVSDHERDVEALVCPPEADTSIESNGSPSDDGHDVTSGTEIPLIIQLYPNPTTYGNVGEFALLEVPSDTGLEGLSITDGHTTAAIPNETSFGHRISPDSSNGSTSNRIAISMDPDVTRNWTSYPVVELDGHLRLATNGDDLELLENGSVVDAVSYDSAPQGNVWYRTNERTKPAYGTLSDPSGDHVDGDGIWWPREATCIPPSTVTPESVEVFVHPDAPHVPIDLFRSADDRLLLAGYTLTSETVAGELHAANDRGVEVEVLLDGGPVGGTSETTDDLLVDLESAGVTVRAIGGEGSRYNFHHPKYAVVDDSVLVTTENWKPSGVGGTSSRGWSVTVRDEDLAAALATTFDADAAGSDTSSWSDHRDDATFVEDDAPDEPFAPEYDPAVVPIDGVELLLAPDNAETRFLELLGDAEESILIKQARIPDPEFPLLEATVDAAREGVEVRVLLDSTWYVEEENRETASRLEEIAAEEDLSIEVILVDSGSRFEKIHAKGVVIDDEVTVVGSANWNENAFRNNREVLLVLYGEEAGTYYATVFEDDWEGESWSLPIELLGTLAIGIVVAFFLGNRQVRFSSGDGRGTVRIDGEPIDGEPIDGEPLRNVPGSAPDDPNYSRDGYSLSPGDPSRVANGKASDTDGRGSSDMRARTSGRRSTSSDDRSENPEDRSKNPKRP